MQRKGLDDKKVFMSDDYKVVLKLQNQINICGCQTTFSTNYDGLFVRILGDNCEEIPTNSLPPATINIENHINIKLDWLDLKAQNSTHFIYHQLFDDMSHITDRIHSNMFHVSMKANLGMMEIRRPFYGIMQVSIKLKYE